MTYIEASDIPDEVLADRVTAGILAETDSEIDGIIYSQGSTPDDMISPIPYEIKQTAIAFACYRAALYASGNVAYGTMPGSFNDTDIFTKKMKIYREEYGYKKQMLTKEIIEGVADTAAERISTVSLART